MRPDVMNQRRDSARTAPIRRVTLDVSKRRVQRDAEHLDERGALWAITEGRQARRCFEIPSSGCAGVCGMPLNARMVEWR